MTERHMATWKQGPVDKYIAARPPQVQPVLRRVRALIRKAVPGLEEGMSYGIPVYKREGELVIFFAGWAKHYALYPALEVAETFAKELAGYEVSRGTIRFPLADVPARLITRIVKFRAKLAKERGALKAERARAKRAKPLKNAGRRATPGRPARASRKAAKR